MSLPRVPVQVSSPRPAKYLSLPIDPKTSQPFSIVSFILVNTYQEFQSSLKYKREGQKAPSYLEKCLLDINTLFSLICLFFTQLRFSAII